jgi:hypothetical protein
VTSISAVQSGAKVWRRLLIGALLLYAGDALTKVQHKKRSDVICVLWIGTALCSTSSFRLIVTQSGKALLYASAERPTAHAAGGRY